MGRLECSSALELHNYMKQEQRSMYTSVSNLVIYHLKELLKYTKTLKSNQETSVLNMVEVFHIIMELES